MIIQKLQDGTLLIPIRIEVDGIIGDSVQEIKPDHAEYDKYLSEYNREQSL